MSSEISLFSKTCPGDRLKNITGTNRALHPLRDTLRDKRKGDVCSFLRPFSFLFSVRQMRAVQLSLCLGEGRGGFLFLYRN